MRRKAARRQWWRRLIAAAVFWRGTAPSEEGLREAVGSDWKTDTGRMRVGLTERMRDIYRRRWLRIRR